jgi:hypothetical protein
MVYEWDQTFSEVNLYVAVPPGVGAKQLEVQITVSHLHFGIKGTPPYLDVSLRACKQGGVHAWQRLDTGLCTGGPGGERQGVRELLDTG